ncbi:TIGR03571 family LLM class oxidoreductase [Lonsdalea quercina]|uniref:TIGR03571 family LLM class oxidoreductase n=1 Tax=Lonsdalea quercina TaxID=71657 RepID=UPI00397594EE
MMQINTSIPSAIDLIRVPGQLTLGIELPLDNDWSVAAEQHSDERYRPHGVPDLSRQEELVRQVDASGFAAIWMRDVPVFDPLGFGDAGSVYDPFVNLGFLAGITHHVALGTAAVVLPLRHPLLVAKAAASADVLSKGRLILGIATGDRPVEFPLLGVNFKNRGDIFRSTVGEIRRIWRADNLDLAGIPTTTDLQVLPKPWNQDIPMIIAGQGRQTAEWIALNMNGRFVYPKGAEALVSEISSWRALRSMAKLDQGVFISAFHLDLDENPDCEAIPHRFGARIGRHKLIEELRHFQSIGVDHLVLHLRRSRRPLDEVLDELARDVVPYMTREYTAPRR